MMEMTRLSKSPQEIIPGVFLGSYDDAIDTDHLKKLGIGAVLNVADFGGHHTQNIYASEMPYVVYGGLPLGDYSGFPIQRYIARTNQFIKQARDYGLGVLIHCQAGVSRSVTILTAYLMAANGWKVDETLERIRHLRPQINPNPGFMRALYRRHM